MCFLFSQEQASFGQLRCEGEHSKLFAALVKNPANFDLNYYFFAAASNACFSSLVNSFFGLCCGFVCSCAKVAFERNDASSNESIQAVFYDLGIIPQKFHIEYHYLSAATTEQHLVELFERIQNQPHEISLILATDSEIDQEIIDEKIWSTNTYIPAEFISSSCLAHPAVQVEQLQPEKIFNLVLNQNNLNQIFQDLKINDLAQYQAEEPFVLVVEDAADIKTVKKLEQFFSQSPVEPHHYLYCKPILGHTQNVAKLFGLMLGAHLSEQQVAFVYGQNLQAFIQAFPEVESDQDSVAIAN